jgi:hypothetical protein
MAPHGPIRRGSGKLLYLGKAWDGGMQRLLAGACPIGAWESDDGLSWRELGRVPLIPGTFEGNYHEPHVVELPSGRLLGHVRLQSRGEYDVTKVELVHFSIVQTASDDEGKSWSEPRPLGFHGSPPHLLRHSSGALVCSYGYRLEPFGERACISRDEGETWEDLVIRDDGPTADLGYPSSVELQDGSIFSVYYQQPETPEDRCGVLWSRWRLPDIS